MKDDPPGMSTLQPMLPPALDHLVRMCLAKEPDRRWQSAGDVERQLTWIAESGSEAGMPAAATIPNPLSHVVPPILLMRRSLFSLQEIPERGAKRGAPRADS
jgi:hypothetical protein